jgi:predicted XRE-type DNA-binding protein
MAQNTFLEAGFSDEDATVYALEADSAAALAKFVQARFPGSQKAAARHLGLHQSEISALLAGNLGRFSLSKLIRIARRAGVRLFLDMGDDAKGANVCTLRPTVLAIPANRADAELKVDLYSEVPGQDVFEPQGRANVVKAAGVN